MTKLKLLLMCFWAAAGVAFGQPAGQVPLRIEHHAPGAPHTVGIPFPLGALYSPDHVRLLDQHGQEVPAQVTEVTTWQPADPSIKWIWVFFFAGEGDEYTLEYGGGVSRAPIEGDRVMIINRQRRGQLTEVNTGPLHFSIKKGAGGFLELVHLDMERNGIGEKDIIAETPGGRGSFLDLFDDAGMDPSRAVVTRTVKEKGSGPLHAIIKVEGVYHYEREDNVPSPFVIRIHAYAGRSYIRVFHTLTYTGTPDKHEPIAGQHAAIAVDKENIRDESAGEGDPGWTQPNDRIGGLGLGLKHRLSGELTCRSGFYTGEWWEKEGEYLYESKMAGQSSLSVFQSGPKPDRIPPVPNSSPDERMQGFFAHIRKGDQVEETFNRAQGWLDLSDGRRGIAVGICHFIEEYPKEITAGREDTLLQAYLWSPRADPMSFARWSDARDSGMRDNFATGLTKTSELVYYFHDASASTSDIQQTMGYFLDAPVAHAHPGWYAQSEVFGRYAPRGETFAEWERGLDYRFEWTMFAQHWEPWYGMFDYGDVMYFYYKDDWRQWLGNEPAVDYMLWFQFMRTGDPRYFRAAEAMSRHTMDVDNIHWPTDEPYTGDTNEALDYWKWKAEPSRATPYLGIGRRHARQHWNSLLSAHVWLQGWLTSYYLTGYHRGLDVAKLSADTYTKRIWGDHGLTGRRLYLSVWNMVEIWDATKDERYLADLQERVQRMIQLQEGPDQYNSLVIDRYGYAQVYASQGLYKYYRLTGDEKVRTALIRHARAVRDNIPWNHAYESYLSTIHSLVVGYELSGEESFLREAVRRAEVLKMDELPAPFEQMGNQRVIAEALEAASHLPDNMGYHEGREGGFTIWSMTQGLRVFGWTHIYNVPWLLYHLRDQEEKGW